MDPEINFGSGTLTPAQAGLLRSNLTNAFVSTYVYAPLTGVLSTTDPNGVTSYYEYDGLQRLKLIKDKDGNILKHYTYNYKQ